MTDRHRTVLLKRRRSTRIRAVAAILAVLLALLVGYGLWTVYENTLTPAAMQGSQTNTKPSSPGELSPTAARALKAYGGEAVWKTATTVESTIIVGGLLFQLKGINIPPHARITVAVHIPHVVIDPVDDSGDIGVLDGFHVMIETRDGKLLEQRADAREHLQNASLTTKWDRLNLLYFLAYAFWGYYTLPNQLMRSDITWTELGDGMLQADYGTSLPVHSRIQRFWFDTKTGLLRRNDYTPVAADPNARVANVVFEHGMSNGIPYTSKRRVKTTLAQYGWVVPFPDFITIDVEAWRLH
ncbi:MAG: hypothetical protein E6I95_10210 [Chloroflexi bacterium]|nr:MAG: hypothetical protein E6I95_10210 [Chloroflexota bacterium]